MGIAIYYFLYVTLSLLGGNDRDVLVMNEVKVEKAYNYIFDENNGEPLDSILVVERKFNKEGYSIETIIYEDNGDVKSLYEYEYLNDTIRQHRNAYQGNREKLIDVTYLRYNEMGQEVLNDSYGEKGERLPMSSIKEYNKKDELSTKIYSRGDTVILEEKYKYDDSGRLEYISTIKKMESKKDFKNHFRIVYDGKGRESHIYELKKPKRNAQKRVVRIYEYNENDQVGTITYNCYKRMNIMGANGCMRVIEDDKLKRKFEYYDNGLIKSVTEYLNGTLNGTRKYYYEF